MATGAAVNLLTQFDGKNFSNWEYRLKLLLEQHEVIEVLDLEEPEDAEENRSFNKKDIKARNIIVQSLSDRVLETVRDKKTAKEIITALQNTYAKTGIAEQVKLQGELRNLKYEGECSMLQFLSKFEKLVADLRAAGGKIDCKEIVVQLLSCMPSNYQSVTTAIDILFSSNPDIVTLDFVKNRLLMEESRQSRIETSNSPEVSMYSNLKKKPNFNNYKGRKNVFSGNGNVSSNNTFKFKCYECGEKGHKRVDCPRKRVKPSFNHIANKDISFLSSVNNEYVSDENNGDKVSFVVDSGATHHLVDLDTGKYLENVTEVNLKINVAKKGESIVSNRCGNLKVTLPNGTNVTIENVYECPGLTKNLLSVKQIESKGISIHFVNNKVKFVQENGFVLLEGNNVGSLYEVQMYFRSSNDALISVNCDLWHRRMGHSSAYPPSTLCEVCVKSKQTRKPFKPLSEEQKATRILETVSSDVCGPVDPVSYNGMKYFVTFIDHFSHFVIVYPMRSKAEVFEKFKEYDAMVCSKFGANIHRLRCDGGGEYVNKDFKHYCSSKGITVEYTVPGTPQQNGIAERFNRTLTETVRCLLYDSQLDKCFWNEALLTAAYLLNRRPTSTLSKGTVPAKVWYNQKPNMEKIKVFGCKAFMHVPKLKRNKLDECSKQLVMIGYAPNGYRLLDLNSKKVVIARDVIFEEMNVTRKGAEENQPDIQKERLNENNKTVVVNHEENETVVINNDESKNPAGCVRRNQRERRPPTWLNDYETNAAFYTENLFDNGPKSYKEAVEFGNGWKEAIDVELNALKKNETWDLVELPENVTLIDSKWVFREKSGNLPGELIKKARLVARGFLQDDPTEEIYAPVARMVTIRTILSIVVHENLEINQLDVTSAFLNGDLNTPVYMLPPEGLDVENGKVCKLKKALYGLKEAPKCWYSKLTNFLASVGFSRSTADPCLYIKNDSYILIYVDDMLLVSRKKSQMDEMKRLLMKEFEMKDLTNIQEGMKFLGIRINFNENGLTMNQSELIEKLVDRFGLSDSKVCAIPIQPKLNLEKTKESQSQNFPFKELVGGLMYVMLGTRPDLSFAITYFSSFQNSYNEQHWNYLKQVLKYLKGTKDYNLVFLRSDSEPINGFVDSDFASDPNDRKSVSGFVFKVFGNSVMWRSRKQSLVALSSAEAEYIALAVCAVECLFLIKLVTELTSVEVTPVTIHEDNQSCMKMARTLETKRSKHIDVKYHFVKNLVADKKIKLEYVSTDKQIADIFTKALPYPKFKTLRRDLGVLGN